MASAPSPSKSHTFTKLTNDAPSASRFALEDFYDAESNSALAVEHFGKKIVGKKIVVWPPRGLFGAWRSSVGWAT